MISLYLVRHGETLHNLEGRIQGHTDSPLTALGVAQAQAVGERLSDENFTAIYSSDLGRTMATAQAIASRQSASIIPTELIREANLGAVQGLTQAEYKAKYPVEFQKWEEDSAKNRPPGAESLNAVIARCGEFLDDIRSKHADGNKILAVVHGGSLRGLICAALNQPPMFFRAISTANASLTILDLGNRASIRLLNDTCHLHGLKVTEEDADNVAANDSK